MLTTTIYIYTVYKSFCFLRRGGATGHGTTNETTPRPKRPAFRYWKRFLRAAARVAFGEPVEGG